MRSKGYNSPRHHTIGFIYNKDGYKFGADYASEADRPSLRIRRSTALLYCFVNTSQQAALENLPSFSHLYVVRVNRQHKQVNEEYVPLYSSHQLVLSQAPSAEL